MKLNKPWLATILGAQLAFTSLAAANTDTNRDSDIEALKQQLQELNQKVATLESQRAAEQQSATNIANGQVQELDQKVRILARERELDQEATAAAAKKQPVVKLDASGFTLASADTNFSISLHGLVQLDSRTFFQNAAQGVDGFILRRTRPIISGTVFHDFDFLFVPDFGGSATVIQDAYLNYRVKPEFQVEAGKFKSPVGLEYLQSDTYLPFNERSLVTSLVPGRDLGVELHGDLFSGTISYAAGIFNGVADSANTANSDFDNDKEFAGRLFFQPLKKSSVDALQGFGFGVSGSYGKETGTAAVNKYKTDGQQNFFSYNSNVSGNGAHWRISPQGYYYYGPFGLLGEYVESSQKVIAGANTGTINNTAWQVVGSWFLTGEKNSYGGVTPAHPFNPANGGWGAWQIVARYANLDMDDDTFKDGFASLLTSASEARAWSVGLNWHLNNNVRVNTSFAHTTFTGGRSAKATVTAYPENVVFTRIQLAF